jgi:hypothetical protein
MDRGQFEALRRQVEDDYKLDIAAIDRLQRRFFGSASPVSGSTPMNGASLSAHSSPSGWSEVKSGIEPPSPVLTPSAPAELKNDELAGSLRSMFAAGRK